MFTFKLVAHPDARMVEVPLEIEAELPREFEGSAVLASSGVPRKVKIKAQKDAFKLSTAYRVDQLAADVVKIALRGTPQDVTSVQEAVLKFVRGVRDRRQEGATLIVSSDGRGKIDALERVPGGKPGPPSESAKPADGEALAALDKRVSELEAGLVERVGQLEARVAAMQKQIARTLAVSEVAGPGMEKMIGRAGAAPAPLARRPTALDAYADGLRDELRGRTGAALLRIRAEVERCDRAAAQAADAEAQGAPRDGTSERLRAASASAAARQTALQRMAEEIDLYPAGELQLAAQLLQKIEASLADGGPAPARAPASSAPTAPAPTSSAPTSSAPTATARTAPGPASSAPTAPMPAGPFGRVAEDDSVKPAEAAAAAVSASLIPKIVAHDPAGTDEALAAEMALAVETEVTAGWQQLPSRPAAFDEPQGPDEVIGGGKHD